MVNNKYFLSKTDFDFKGKRVLVRIDCDVDLKTENGKLIVDEDFRLKSAIPTIEFLLSKRVEKIILLGHIGRPEGKVTEELKLKPVAEWFFCHSESSSRVERSEIEGSLSSGEERDSSTPELNSVGRNDDIYQIGEKVFLLENLRFNGGEEKNDEEFVRNLGSLGDVFINEAFGVSHREHASITGIPKILPSFLGINFENEIVNLSKLSEDPKRPLVFVLGGSKKDKMDYLEFLGEWCDLVLIGGKLPQMTSDFKFQISNFKFAALTENGRDISNDSIKEFVNEINKAAAVVWAGPMGVYEEEENKKGTYEIAKAISECGAFKIAGGGDTHRILGWMNLWDKFDFISSGGGAMLFFLKNKSLFGIKAITND